METYLVGGAVRDKLLNYPVSERDWVVVGVTAEQMLEAGYRPVGKDFPVFLHPQTNEEYALARTERKTGRGYTGFHCFTSPDVSLEEDLRRRDLTINAIAEDAHGNLIDPYGGQEDLKNKLLRHVSAAFEEDPLRVLRVARFYARYHQFGFRIADETFELMRLMVARGELKELVAERVWMEIHRALKERQPEMFFRVLYQIGGMDYLMPEFAVEKLLDRAVEVLNNLLDKSEEAKCRFASVYMHLHESRLLAWCETYRVPREFRDLTLLVKKNIGGITAELAKNAHGMLGLLESLDAFRRPDRFARFVIVCEAAFHVEEGSDNDFRVGNLLKDALRVSAHITAADVDANLQGKAIGDAIAVHRISLIEQLLEGK
ncbi:MAG: multifunctional CCA tRNA nucleotidyl transferase/2'3'-cyclic phosphodiesterase/2'nucleotidase/phosphatase [Gammaproteobacteria bacterium]|nr:multifunctional CCA tRNA nucleotidyl transferase/2'3'-cyclic phosphodiesterase/2'nucleotidase/phosphatase [Gammaproteobacteria bacterium]